MDEGDARLERLFDLIEAMRLGKIDPRDCEEEMKDLVGERFAPLAAITESDIIQGKFEAGEISAAEAMFMAQRNADDFPAVPILFIYCSYYATHLDAPLDSIGYLALYKMKCERMEDPEFGRHLEWEDMIKPLLKKLEREEALLSVWPYLEEGGEHLVSHFILQDITYGVFYEESEWRDAVLARLDDLEPLFITMLEDQFRLHVEDYCEQPSGLDTLVALLGCRKSREALPVLLDALAVCVGAALNETVLALAKLGSRHPEEVSRELRAIAADSEYGEARLAAVETLGLLWEAPGNLDFLRDMLEKWRPNGDDEDEGELFRFLAHALLLSGQPSAAQAVSSALERHRGELDRETVAFAEDYLEHWRDIRLGPRLEDVLAEEPEGFLAWPPSDLARERRCTLTLQREYALAAAAEESLPEIELDIIEEIMRGGRNEPCACGSGLKFKKCCLPRFEEMRNRLLRGEELKAVKTPYQLLWQDLERFAALPSIRAEKAKALEEFLAPLGRSWIEEDPSYHRLNERGFFEEWFLLVRPLEKSGRTVVQEMLERRGDALDPVALGLLRGLAASRFSVYEVQEVAPGRGLTLRDIFRGDRISVRDRSASRNVARWDLLATYIGQVGNHYEMLGISFTVPRRYLGALEFLVDRASREMIEAKEAESLDDFLERHVHLLFHQVTRIAAAEPRPVSITEEGDEIAFCTALFDVRSPEKVRRALSAHPYIEDLGGRQGVRNFIWYLSREMEDELRRGEHVGPQGESRTFSASPKDMTVKQEKAEIRRGNVMRSLGNLQLRGKRLTFSAHSLQRLEAGKRELETLLAGVATHRADSIEDQEALLGKAWRGQSEPRGKPSIEPQDEEPPVPPRLGDVPPELLQKAFDELTERLYGNWLDEPIPYLGGKTPREAAKTAEGRELVNRLLKDYENQAEHDRKAGLPTYDFSRFRRELDIWP